MTENPDCPICHRREWRTLAIKTFSRQQSGLSPYVAIRREVLFDIWYAGSDNVELKSVVCENCGFACYTPRPDNNDIARKYQYLEKHETAGLEFSASKASDKVRARELYRFLNPWLPRKRCSVLDYGGGNGRLLGDFVRQGHDCHLVELVDKALPGIKYIGPEINEVTTRFDAIICSHVLEHLADPLSAVNELTSRLEPHGILYVEVPNEIFGKIPPGEDPVTHINFFSVDSMRSLLEMAGLAPEVCRYAPFTRPNGKIGEAVKAVSRRGRGAAITEYRGPGQVISLSSAGILAKVARAARYPVYLKNFLKRPDRQNTENL